MPIKRIFGYIFMLVSVLLAFAFIMLLGDVFTLIVGIVKIFRGQLSQLEVGRVIGTFIYWFTHISLVIVLWDTGKRWIKTQ